MTTIKQLKSIGFEFSSRKCAKLSLPSGRFVLLSCGGIDSLGIFEFGRNVYYREDLSFFMLLYKIEEYIESFEPEPPKPKTLPQPKESYVDENGVNHWFISIATAASALGHECFYLVESAQL